MPESSRSSLGSEQLEPIGYIQAIQEKIKSFTFYPLQAKEKRLKGVVKVSFRIQRNGKIKNLRVISSSGYSSLDEAALQTIIHSAPFVLPPNFTKNEIEITIIIEYFPNMGHINKQQPSIEKSTNIINEGWFKTVQEKILSHIVYPQEAREKKWEGIAKTSFFIKKDGTVDNVRIEKSSGYLLLDKIAVTAVKNSGPYSFPFKDRKKISVILPVEFSSGKGNRQAKTSASFKKCVRTPSEEKKSPAPQGLKTKKDQQRKTDLIGGLKLDNLYSSESLPLDLKKFIEIALKNNQPLQVAKEEISLAKLKVKEALRNLYPSLKLLTYNTTGTTNKIDYEEREFQVEMKQPLYYGGRLKNAYTQAKVNLEITKKGYDQRLLDTIHKTAISYYTLVALQMNLEKQNKIIKRAKKIMEITERLYKKNAIISLEFNDVKSSYEELKLRKDSIVQELKMAYLVFKQALNVKESPLVNPLLLSVKKFDLTLSKCIDKAIEFRPEINLAKLSVRFYEYNKKMEEAKSKFNIDLASSYGSYAGHYLTEPWKDSQNWYIGVKITKAFGANTSTTSLTKEESQPKFGETSPTESRTISTELAVLDNLKRLTEKKDAEISLLKAQDQLKETKKNITFEVQDNFLKYQKSLLELESSLTQKNFREEALKITKTKVYRGEGEYPSLIKALVSLSETEDIFLRAVSNYYISLASLQKATGYGISIVGGKILKLD